MVLKLHKEARLFSSSLLDANLSSSGVTADPDLPLEEGIFQQGSIGA